MDMRSDGLKCILMVKALLETACKIKSDSSFISNVLSESNNKLANIEEAALPKEAKELLSSLYYQYSQLFIEHGQLYSYGIKYLHVLCFVNP